MQYGKGDPGGNLQKKKKDQIKHKAQMFLHEKPHSEGNRRIYRGLKMGEKKLVQSRKCVASDNELRKTPIFVEKDRTKEDQKDKKSGEKQEVGEKSYYLVLIPTKNIKQKNLVSKTKSSNQPSTSKESLT